MKINAKQRDRGLCVSLILVLLAFASCDSGSTVRKYKEKEKTSPVKVQKQPPGHAHFQWDTPGGWKEERKASGFRIATFTIKGKDKESVCTVIPLKGEAGGLKANVTLWLEQISSKTDLAGHSEDIVNKLLKAQEKFLTTGQFPAVFIDFTPVSPNPSDKSILVTVITVGGSSVFIKMMGEKSHLMENKEKFKALCKSFTIGHKS